ncbi:MAG: hydrogenase nickel incorporation protein HypB [Phycisphaerae bacterium]|jgi:hydrogenase nickel incorporation protein HypB
MKINVRKNVLSDNDQQALTNAQRLAGLGISGVNILASPGAGKTTFIVRLLQALPGELNNAVVEGDVASSIDTDRIIALGFAATQINTGGGCHLDASMVASALDKLTLRGPGFLFIENIGNLICPADFRLGESLRLVVASVPEGDDKPVKYPAIFRLADAVVLNKIDLLGHVEFTMDNFVAGVRAVNAAAPIFEVSARNGAGIDKVVEWLREAGKR